jgi:hypothetical protein
MSQTFAIPLGEAWPPFLGQAAARDLDEAAAAVAGLERARVEFLRQGLRYVDLTLAAVEKTPPELDWGFSDATRGNANATWSRSNRTSCPPASGSATTTKTAVLCRCAKCAAKQYITEQGAQDEC